MAELKVVRMAEKKVDQWVKKWADQTAAQMVVMKADCWVEYSVAMKVGTKVGK